MQCRTSALDPTAGHVAVVTGANSGIGYETARCLAAAGARVFVGSRNAQNGEKACADIR